MKKIHALTIIDKSTSMNPYRSHTIDGINSNMLALKKEVDADTEILNTQLQFSSNLGGIWGLNFNKNTPVNETDFVFVRVGEKVNDLSDMTEKDYVPEGWTPLLDAIGHGIEKLKEFHKDDLGSDDLKIIVSIFSDGEENSSKKWSKVDIKKMIDHFQSDGKWVFTFIGCGGIDDVSSTSADLGISKNNTVAYAATSDGYAEGFSKISTSYRNFSKSVKSGISDNGLFTEKVSK